VADQLGGRTQLELGGRGHVGFGVQLDDQSGVVIAGRHQLAGEPGGPLDAVDARLVQFLKRSHGLQRKGKTIALYFLFVTLPSTVEKMRSDPSL